METNQAAKNKSAMTAASALSAKHSELIADWLTLYAQTYHEEITPELALLYLQTLKDFPPTLLHQAFLEAAKKNKFRPTPAEIRDQAERLREKQRPAYDPLAKTDETCPRCEPDGWVVRSGKAVRCKHEA